ncbi:MAG: mechanosensitive ion channel family protein [Flavobacteriales bacterium]|nr:mechanosensitive ion channel family protein [Flavobacteriales bacterium]
MDAQFQLISWMALAALAGAALGWLLDRLSLGRLRRLALRTESHIDDAVISAFNGMLPFWCGLIGIHLAMRSAGSGEAWIAPMGRVMLMFAVFTICLVAARVSASWIRNSTSGLGGGTATASILGIIARVLIFSVGALIVLHDLGISIAPMVTALGVGGLAVALALQDTLSNLFAGLQLIASRQVNVGDYVKLESGEEGYLTDITWRNTTIRALPNHMIVVPNAKLASSIVQNHQLPDAEVAVLVQVGVSYDSDLDHVEKVTIATAGQVLRRLQPTLKDFDPFIRYHTFAESSIGFSVILRAAEFTERFQLMHEFIKALHQKYREEGIVIPYPIRTVKMDVSKHTEA